MRVPRSAEPHRPCLPATAASAMSSPARSAKRFRIVGKTTPADLPVRTPDVVEDVGEETEGGRQMVYLVTISRVLPAALESGTHCQIQGLATGDVATAVRDCLENPLVGEAGGRRSAHDGPVVQKLVAVKEKHCDGDVHFHVAVALAIKRAFAPAKRALQARSRMPSHWSCSHTQWWSALRYCVIPSEKKPVVDASPVQWHYQGAEIDLFAEAQQPFQAAMWKRRREKKDAEHLAGVGKRATFSKLDLTAVILKENLETKAAVLAYAQRHGTSKMQEYVHAQQARLKQILQEAKEWGVAQQEAQREREGDWALLCRIAAEQCSGGGACPYAQAAHSVFECNRSVLSRDALAASLRKVLLHGPSKTARVPLIVGPTNTGKTTLVLPFDKLFGHKHVFHKPALGSKFALRNILRDKRFILWDDYRPVAYGRETVHVSTFLSLFTGLPFEVQVSQSFTDGNEDFMWKRGAVLTAKEEGLWVPSGGVTDEDVRHMQSRVEIFRCAAQVPSMRSVDPCAACMCRWIAEGAGAYDAAALLNGARALGQVAAAAQAEERGQATIAGFAELVIASRLPHQAVQRLTEELMGLGVVDVGELSVQDWKSLETWSSFRVFEQRRLLNEIWREQRDA